MVFKPIETFILLKYWVFTIMSWVEVLKGGIFQNIDNQLGLYLLLGLIPLILLYLIKPKPHEKTIPSLMFLIRNVQKETRHSFLRRFVQEFLFFLQFLIIIMLVTSATHPFIKTDKMVDAEFTVLVLDLSARSNVKVGLTSRFSRIIDEAKDNLDGEISIVLVKNEPFIALDGEDRGAAIDVLATLEPTSSLSPIGTSILTAGNLLKDKKGKIVVISDFVDTGGIVPWVAKKTLEAKGQMVEFIDIKKEGENVGIVDVQSTEDESFVIVKNYNEELDDVTVLVNNEKYYLSIGPGMSEKLEFMHDSGVNTVKLDSGDSFSLDDTVYISIPEERIIRALMITNDYANYIEPVVSAYAEAWNDNLILEVANPPVLPVINHDLIIIAGVETGKLPKTIIKRIKELVEDEGSVLVVVAQDDLDDLDFEDELPVVVGDEIFVESVVYNTYVLSQATSEINFGTVSRYFSASAKENAVVLAESQEDHPLVAYHDYGEGKVVYYGLIGEYSTFKHDISYPLFWQGFIDYLVNRETVELLNFAVGDKLVFDDEIDVKSPSNTFKTVQLDFDETGIYEFKGNTVACNLLSKVESGINYLDEGSDDLLLVPDSQIQIKQSLTKYFLIAFLIFSFFELFYIKYRGDL